ncbi:MAG: hypothetical protein RKE49_00845 [Oceanicaulis sp.]
MKATRKHHFQDHSAQLERPVSPYFMRVCENLAGEFEQLLETMLRFGLFERLLTDHPLLAFNGVDLLLIGLNDAGIARADDTVQKRCNLIIQLFQTRLSLLCGF